MRLVSDRVPELTEPNAHLARRPVVVTARGLTEKQLATVAASTGVVNIWEGAVSSGKTIASLYRWLMHVAATREYPGEIVLFGRTREAAWRNVISPLMQLFPGTTTGNMGAPSVKVLNQRVNVIGAHDERAESVIRGITAKSIYGDELTTCPQGFFDMAVTRLRVAAPNGALISKMFGSTNPDNPHHWLKEKLDAEVAEWRRFHFALTDNPRLSAEYISLMERQYTGLFRRRFILGEWVAGEGAIWDTWDEDVHVVSLDEVPPLERIVAVGVDFGSNHPSAGVALGLAGGALWVLDEWAPMRERPGTTLAPSTQADMFNQWLVQLIKTWGRRPEFVFVDGAAKAFRDQLYISGTVTAPAWKNVTPGVQLVHSLFTTGKLFVVDWCDNLIRSIPGYIWDSKKVDRGEDVPLKEDDDFPDALRYAVASSKPQWQGRVPILLPTAIEEHPGAARAA